MSKSLRGFLAVILAYAIWGLFPIYWKQLHEIDSLELFFIRIILTSVFCLLILPLRGSFGKFIEAVRSAEDRRFRLFAALMLSGNWIAFIWAVTNGHVLESSLGYFLSPLASVMMGRFFEGEPLSKTSWMAVGCAFVGVLLMIFTAESVPVSALVIALTWSSYGLMKKRTRLGPIVSLGLETSLLVPISIISLGFLAQSSGLTVLEVEPRIWTYLLFAGALTATPLLLFAYAAQRIQLSTMGMGQYIVPTAHFALAVYYGELVKPVVLVAFGFIWCGLLIYALSARKSSSQG